MGLINWIFDIYQHGQIDKARTEAAEARATAATLQAAAIRAAPIRGSGGSIDGEPLERALGELALATKTLQRMMVEKGLCSSEEFASRLRQIDLEDGRADGRSSLPG